MGRRYQVEVTGPDTLAMAAYQLKDGRRTVHLVNYDAPRPPRDIRIALDAAKATKATLNSRERRSVLPVRVAGARAHLRMAVVEIYAVLVIE